MRQEAAGSLSRKIALKFVQITHAELSERAKRDSLPELPHAVKVEGQVMSRAERRREDLAAVVDVSDVGARIPPADPTFALFVERAIVLGKPGVFVIYVGARIK
jgi:hypothetical protein